MKKYGIICREWDEKFNRSITVVEIKEDGTSDYIASNPFLKSKKWQGQWEEARKIIKEVTGETDGFELVLIGDQDGVLQSDT